MRQVVFHPESVGKTLTISEEAVKWSKLCFTVSENWTGKIWEGTCREEAGRTPGEEDRAEGIGNWARLVAAGKKREREKRQNLNLIWQPTGRKWIKESSEETETWVGPGFSQIRAPFLKLAGCRTRGYKVGTTSGWFCGKKLVQDLFSVCLTGVWS